MFGRDVGARDGASPARIKVVGVGGGGGNAVEQMIRKGVEGVEFIVANTDAQALDRSAAPRKIALGARSTRGLGAGGRPERGHGAARESENSLAVAMAGADMVFVTAGMGGGTGTGAAPIVGALASDLGALTVGVVTRPFAFEGKRRAEHAAAGIEALRAAVDSVIVLPNDNLMVGAGEQAGIEEAFSAADEVLCGAVRGISDLVVRPGLVNVDFADVRSVMKRRGHAVMGAGYGRGPDAARIAVERAIESPFLEERGVRGATGMLVNFTAGPQVKLRAIDAAVGRLQEEADAEVEIIFGLITEPRLDDVVMATVVATGLERGPAQLAPLAATRPVLLEEEQRAFPGVDPHLVASFRRSAGA